MIIDSDIKKLYDIVNVTVNITGNVYGGKSLNVSEKLPKGKPV